MKHHESTVVLNTKVEDAFSYLDDFNKLSSHMEKSSWMMAGSKMSLQLDSKKGQAVGSRVTMQGKMMGIPLYVSEDVTERVPPFKKSWATQGRQRLVVIEQYRMGFELTPEESKTRLKVFIEYSLPSNGISRILGKLFGPIYASWCTEKMVKDAAHHFG